MSQDARPGPLVSPEADAPRNAAALTSRSLHEAVLATVTCPPFPGPRTVKEKVSGSDTEDLRKDRSCRRSGRRAVHAQ